MGGGVLYIVVVKHISLIVLLTSHNNILFTVAGFIAGIFTEYQELQDSIEQPGLDLAQSGRFSAMCDFPSCSL